MWLPYPIPEEAVCRSAVKRGFGPVGPMVDALNPRFMPWIEVRVADIYFDISDLIAYASAHATVSGIQRVQIRLLSELARAPRAENTWCVAVHPQGRGRVAWRLADIGADIEHDLRIFHRLADGIAGRGRRNVVRRHVNQLGLRGWRRAIHKVGAYSRLLLDTATGVVPAHGMHLSHLPQEATLVILGAGWNDPCAAAFAADHAGRGGRVVQCVYDLIPIMYPTYFDTSLAQSFSRHLSQAVGYASEFVCISQRTQDDLHAYLRDRNLRLPSTVVPLAHEFHGHPRNARGCQPDDGTLLAFGSRGREFVLCVGTLEIRKNGMALLEAWLRLRSQLGDATPHLIFCGRRGWKVDPFFDLLQRDEWLKHRVRIISGAHDNDIAYLHEQSLCSVYPSLYEGWGLPVGEAAWFGRTCITSKESSLPEVCGPLVDYVDPRNPRDIAGRVCHAVLDRGRLRRRERLISAARLRTWREVASDFHQVVHGADGATIHLDRFRSSHLRRAA